MDLIHYNEPTQINHSSIGLILSNLRLFFGEAIVFTSLLIKLIKPIQKLQIIVIYC